MLDHDVLDIADRWWARGFGCESSELRPVKTHVQEHAGTEVGSTGIWILVVGEVPMVSLPKSAFPRLADRAHEWTRGLVSDAAALAEEVRSLEADDMKVSKIVGPAFIGYGTANTLKLPCTDQVRMLTPADDVAVKSLRKACDEEEWDNGGSDHNKVPAFGCFNDQGTLLALAGYKTWGRAIAHISIVSDPGQRKRGFASRTVARAAKHALDAGLLPQYRTLASNEPSMGIAKKLGFKPYGFSVYVRLEAV